MRRTIAATVLLALGLVARPAAAQVGSTQGIFAGVQYTGAAIDLKAASKNVKFGGGYGIHAGIGFGQTYSLLLNYDSNKLPGTGTTAGDVKLTQVDALLRMHILATAQSPIRPFLTAGATGRTAKGITDVTGVSPTGGAGVTVQLIPGISLSGTALWTFGNLTSKSALQSGGTSFASTGTRVQVGASMYLLGH